MVAGRDDGPSAWTAVAVGLCGLAVWGGLVELLRMASRAVLGE